MIMTCNQKMALSQESGPTNLAQCMMLSSRFGNTFIFKDDFEHLSRMHLLPEEVEHFSITITTW